MKSWISRASGWNTINSAVIASPASGTSSSLSMIRPIPQWQNRIILKLDAYAPKNSPARDIYQRYTHL